MFTVSVTFAAGDEEGNGEDVGLRNRVQEETCSEEK